MLHGLLYQSKLGTPSYFRRRAEKKSEEYGLTVWLCHNHHNENVKGNPGVHHSRELDLWLKKLGQQAFEREFPEKDFLREFGRSYR